MTSKKKSIDMARVTSQSVSVNRLLHTFGTPTLLENEDGSLSYSWSINTERGVISAVAPAMKGSDYIISDFTIEFSAFAESDIPPLFDFFTIFG